MYFASEFLAPLLMGIALWRSRTVPRWLAALFFVGLQVAELMGSFGPIVVLYMLPFAAAMVLLAARIWHGAAVPDAGATPWSAVEPASVRYRRPERTPLRSGSAAPEQLNCEDKTWPSGSRSRTRERGHCVPGPSTSDAPSSQALHPWRISPSARRRIPAHLSLAASLIVAVLTAGALPLRRVWPGPVFLWTLVAAAVLAQWPAHGTLFPVALAIALYTVATTMRRAEALAAAVLAAGVVVLVVAQDGTRHWALAISDAVGFAAAVLLVGLYVGTRRAYLAELRDRARRLERERDARPARWLRRRNGPVSPARCTTAWPTTSRSSWRSLTAPSAPSPAHPPRPCDAIRDVSGTARQALAETRRLLGVLRADSGQESRQPLPNLADLDDLVARVRAAGLPVRYERTGAAAPTRRTGVQLAVFRLVQEALTNTMKHAGPRASAAVRLQVSPRPRCAWTSRTTAPVAPPSPARRAAA